jgi:hypothetical protein
MATNDEQHESSKVHGDKLATSGHTAAAPGTPAPAGDARAINPDHPDQRTAPGTGGLMPGSYEQAGGEAGHADGERGAADEDDVIRAPGSRVPHPELDPSIRQRALDIAKGSGGEARS